MAARHAGPVNYEPVDPATLATALVGSSAQLEMAVRVGQSLELTDALWDLVPVVVAAGEQHDRMSPGEVADASPSGRRLDEDARSRIREAARQWEEKAYSAFDAHALDESVVAALSRAEVIADPYRLVAALVDLPSARVKIFEARVSGIH